MKECDQVRVINDKDFYSNKNIYKGMTGFIMDPRCINGKWLVCFDGEFKQALDGVWYTTDIECAILEEDLEVISKL